MIFALPTTEASSTNGSIFIRRTSRAFSEPWGLFDRAVARAPVDRRGDADRSSSRGTQPSFIGVSYSHITAPPFDLGSRRVGDAA